MNQEEMMLARDARRQLEKRSLDTTMAQISVSRGIITVSGQLRGLKTDPGADVQHEVEIFRLSAPRYLRGVRDVILECRIVANPKRQKPDEHGHGGDQTHTHIRK